MSKAQLKKQLKTLEKDEIIEMVMELYDARKEAKEYLEFYLNPNEKANWTNTKKSLKTNSILRAVNRKRDSVCAERLSMIL